MQYMGSKNKIAKHITPIILDCIKDNNIKNYVEFFVGGGNIIDKIHVEGLKKIGYDYNPYLIALLSFGVQCYKHNIQPAFVEKLSREYYNECRDAYKKGVRNSIEDIRLGYVGFFGSYNGRFFDGGFAAPSATRDYYNEKKNNFLKQLPNLAEGDISFIYSNYIDLIEYYLEDRNTFLYLDPPYAGTKQYNVSKNFDNNLFWENVRKISVNNYVLVSEQKAPEDFICIKEIGGVTRSINSKETAHKKVTEKLFIADNSKMKQWCQSKNII